jgi:hypothetical protein
LDVPPVPANATGLFCLESGLFCVSDAQSEVWRLADGCWESVYSPTGPASSSSVQWLSDERTRIFRFQASTGELFVVDTSKPSLSWERIALEGEAPSARREPSVSYSRSDDRILVFGGVDETGGGGYCRQTVHLADLQSNRWISAAAPADNGPRDVAAGANVAMWQGDELLFFGRRHGSNGWESFIYGADRALTTWKKIVQLPATPKFVLPLPRGRLVAYVSEDLREKKAEEQPPPLFPGERDREPASGSLIFVDLAAESWTRIETGALPQNYAGAPWNATMVSDGDALMLFRTPKGNVAYGLSGLSDVSTECAPHIHRPARSSLVEVCAEMARTTSNTVQGDMSRWLEQLAEHFDAEDLGTEFESLNFPEPPPVDSRADDDLDKGGADIFGIPGGPPALFGDEESRATPVKDIWQSIDGAVHPMLSRNMSAEGWHHLWVGHAEHMRRLARDLARYCNPAGSMTKSAKKV